jgi:hypothetical protein
VLLPLVNEVDARDSILSVRLMKKKKLLPLVKDIYSRDITLSNRKEDNVSSPRAQSRLVVYKPLSHTRKRIWLNQAQ